ncbi:hypothetical protein HPB50_003938 [Hyalomma asiaticum]|uniref:Uncharacterized protein n=1 Tax=Hyalomma asiaticum TaxID=266040 RepID=A0ACB7RHM7_HYAAI|nr:hypothetical protein HPB50_003938 [Hyalomma asiaticum]
MSKSAKHAHQRNRVNEQPQSSVPRQLELPEPSGPYRGASKPGIFITMLEFPGVRDKFKSLADEGNAEQSIDIEVGSLGGYTFGVRCVLRRDDAGEVKVFFDVCLVSGCWDNNVEWPFAKKITLIISHTEDREKDITLPLCASRECAVVRKPHPGCCNEPHRSEPLSWAEIEDRGLISNNILYVNVELE